MTQKLCYSVTKNRTTIDEDRSQVRSGEIPQLMAALHNSRMADPKPMAMKLPIGSGAIESTVGRGGLLAIGLVGIKHARQLGLGCNAARVRIT